MPARYPSGSASSYSGARSWKLTRRRSATRPILVTRACPLTPRGRCEQDEHPSKATALDVVEEKPHDVLSVRADRVRTSPKEGTRRCGPYTERMTVVSSEREHESLVEELIASVETYNPGVDRELIRRAFEYAEERHR